MGPGSEAESIWQAMGAAGVTGFRLNTSYLNLDQSEQWPARLAPFLARADSSPPVVLDLQGSKRRLGEFPACTLVEGQRVTLIRALEADQPGLLPVPHPDFFRAAELSSGEVVLNDARVRLQVESSTGDRMRARVVTGHTLSARKGLTCTETAYGQESLSERDQAIIPQGVDEQAARRCRCS